MLRHSFPNVEVVSFSFFWPKKEMMMDFCKSVHALLGFLDPKERRLPPVAPLPPPLRRCRRISSRDSEGLRIIAGEMVKQANVVEKTGQVRPPEKTDPGARGLLECCYDDGLMLCTESLGFESCCDGRVVAAEEEAAAVLVESSSGAGEEAEEGRRSRRGRSVGRREGREFPPPLSWLAGNGGRRTRYLVPERKDGRLVIKLKIVDRPDIFAATREDGRLRLYLIETETETEEEDEEEEEEEEVETASEVTEEEERGERWEWRRGEIEGVRRCQEAVSGNEVVPLWWNHRFVTMA